MLAELACAAADYARDRTIHQLNQKNTPRSATVFLAKEEQERNYTPGAVARPDHRLSSHFGFVEGITGFTISKNLAN